MKRKLSYAIVIALCGMMGFTSCTKDYDDDLRIHREMIENNEKELRATIDAYQVLVNNTIEQMEIAYKNADNLIKQEMKAEFDAMVDYVKSSPAPDPVNNPVLTPGEPERLRMADRLANGVEISDGEMAAILNVCQAAGVHHHWEVI